MTYKDTILKLFELQKFGMKFGLDSMQLILKKLSNPERGGTFVHVAGTNGKGSTLAFLASILRLSGYKTGLYTSPHLVSFRERIQLDGVLLSEEDVIELASIIWKATDPEHPPTFFEFVTAMAFVYFKEKGADIVLLETGLGGRLDSTNVVDPLISAVTNIGLEHTEQLGNTIEAIAFEKAGVIKEGKPFAAGRLVGDALKVIEDRAKSLNTKVKLLGRDYNVRTGFTPEGYPKITYQGLLWNFHELELGLHGAYQADNAALALVILELIKDLGFKSSAEIIERGLRRVSWPGRGELFEAGTWPEDKSAKAPLILDGAHNPDGAKAFAEFLEKRPHEKIHLVVGVMADKDIVGVLTPVLKLASRLYLTRPQYQRAADPELLLQKITEAYGVPDNLEGLYPFLPSAIEAAAVKAGPKDLVVVTGSLFTVGEARAYLTGEKDLESN